MKSEGFTGDEIPGTLANAKLLSMSDECRSFEFELSRLHILALLIDAGLDSRDVLDYLLNARKDPHEMDVQPCTGTKRCVIHKPCMPKGQASPVRTKTRYRRRIKMPTSQDGNLVRQMYAARNRSAWRVASMLRVDPATLLAMLSTANSLHTAESGTRPK